MIGQIILVIAGIQLLIPVINLIKKLVKNYNNEVAYLMEDEELTELNDYDELPKEEKGITAAQYIKDVAPILNQVSFDSKDAYLEQSSKFQPIKSRYVDRGIVIEVEDLDGRDHGQELKGLNFSSDEIATGVIWKEILDRRRRA